MSRRDFRVYELQVQRLSTDDDLMHCNNYNVIIWHQLYFHTQSTFWNLSLLLHSCTQEFCCGAPKHQFTRFPLLYNFLNIPPSLLLPACYSSPSWGAAISGCRPSDWCLPQAGQTGVNVIFSSLFLSPNYVTPSGKLDHCPVASHQSFRRSESLALTAGLVATSFAPPVKQWRRRWGVLWVLLGPSVLS